MIAYVGNKSVQFSLREMTPTAWVSTCKVQVEGNLEGARTYLLWVAITARKDPEFVED